MSIVVIEGPDGSGKTTLAMAYADLVGARYLHAEAPKLDSPHPLVAYTEPLNPAFNYVLDRWHLGEHVYGPIIRGKSSLTLRQSRAIDEMMMERTALLIHCNGTYSQLAKRLRDRGEEPHATLAREAQAFSYVATNYTLLPVLQSPITAPITPEEIRDAVARTRS